MSAVAEGILGTGGLVQDRGGARSKYGEAECGVVGETAICKRNDSPVCFGLTEPLGVSVFGSRGRRRE